MRQRWDCRTAALQRLIFPNMFIITLHYLNYQQEKPGGAGGREGRELERQGRQQGEEKLPASIHGATAVVGVGKLCH